VWKGGLGIWGEIALGTLAGLWVLRRRGAHVAVFMDAAAPALLVAQAIGRVGNYFNQELFGGPTTLPWALEISPAVAALLAAGGCSRSPAAVKGHIPAATMQPQTRLLRHQRWWCAAASAAS